MIFRKNDVDYKQFSGEMVEWLKAAVLKTAVAAMSPWVRIPLSPPCFLNSFFPFFIIFLKRYKLSKNFTSKDVASADLAANQEHYTFALAAICSGKFSIMYQWFPRSGTELATKTTFKGHSVGFGFSNGTDIFIDKDASSGAETVSVNVVSGSQNTIPCSTG